MKKIIFLLIALLIFTGCTKVTLEGSYKAKEGHDIEKKAEALNISTEEELNYDTPTDVIDEIKKETEVKSFGDVI